MNIKTLVRIAVPAAFAVTATVAAAGSAAAQDPLPIGPNQYFNAQVNGKTANAAITVVCPGPVTSTSTGHPIAGQSVEVFLVLPPVTPGLGYTGSAAHDIDAYFGPLSSAANPPVVLTGYFVKFAIPTTLNLPCGGTGAVSFVPTPPSPTARNYVVSVTYLNIGA
jgi:hypothetical protein